MSAVIELKDVDFAYSGTPILQKLCFEVKQGVFVGIAGPNGAGKTTLLNIICGILSPGDGSVKIDAINLNRYSIKSLAKKIAVVRQESMPVFEYTVAEIISMARTPYMGALGFESKVDIECIERAMELTETAQFASRSLAELSGGERQRVFIARALAQDTDILLLDEPTSSLDLRHQVHIYDLLKKLQFDKKKTIISVTHDINLAAQYCDEALLLGHKGEYYAGKTGEILRKEMIDKVFEVNTFEGEVHGVKFLFPLGKFSVNRL